MIILNHEKMMQRVLHIESYSLQVIKANKDLDNLYEYMREADNDVFEHSVQVRRVALILGIAYNLNLNELITMGVGASLHDIGKIYLDKEILYKPDRLTDNEKIFINAHTNLGYKMVKDLDLDPMIAEIIKSHHEKIDSNGYPDGLNKSQLPIIVQLVTIADVFAALTSKRVYKDAFSKEEAYEIMENDKGLNQIGVSLLKELIERYGLEEI